MRRKEREVTDTGAILDIINECKVCRLAMMDGGGPYLVPMNYGYSGEDPFGLKLYFHSAAQGRKIDCLRQNPRVCFEMDCAHRLRVGENACEYGYAYKSVIGYGYARFLQAEEEKRQALERIMIHQAGPGEYRFSQGMISRTCVFVVNVTTLTAKECQ